MVVTNKRSSSNSGEISPDVPVFLQKAYHMIDECDTKICCWSDDGLTFIVKDVSLFETTIIPQFFKHNKFASFVRQLNFYGFRKVKFSNTLRIDHKLEKQTAKYWRFRHEYFRRGRKDLLTEIKRTPSTSMASTANTSASSSFNNNKKTVVAVPSIATSSSTTTLFNNNNNHSNHSSTQEVTHLKTEMKELKQRVASMVTNIDELTDMVKKVSVKEASSVISPGAEWGEFGNKRKKMAITAEAVKRDEETDDVIMKDLLPIMPDWTSSSDFATVDDSLLLSGDPLPDLAVSSNSPSPAPSDDTFVDDLFQAFAEEDAILPGLEGADESNSKASPAMEDTTTNNNNNKPDPQLMKRIEDSLSTIPRDMHELVANRLIDAITETKPIVESASSLGIFPSSSRQQQQQGMRSRSSSFGSSEGENCKKKADRSISVDENMENGAPTKQAQVDKAAISSTIPLPVAVSALKTILAEYGVSVECRSSCKNAESRFASKSLPVIPMHA